MTNNKYLLQTIKHLKEPDFSQVKNKNNYQKIRQEWKKIIAKYKKDIEKLYYNGTISDWVEVRTKMEKDFAFEDEIMQLLLNWLEQIDWSKTEDVKVLFKYITLVSNGDFGNCYLAVSKYHKRIVNIVRKLIQMDDFIIEEDFNGGNFGELIEKLINLYFYHASHSWSNIHHIEQYETERAEIATLIPDFIKAFPKNCSGLIMSLLENNSTNLVTDIADLLHFHIVNQIEYNYSFTSELFGKYQKPSDPIYKKAPVILKETIKNTLTDDQIAYLVDVLIHHLDIDSFEKQVASTRKYIDEVKKFRKKELVEKQEKELAYFITNFDEIYAKKWAEAVRRLTVSSSIYKSVEITQKAFPEHSKVHILAKLLKEAKAFKDKPKIYKLNQKPSIVFKDLHFKYLVIEELMYKQKILKPLFDVREFAAEYSKREIDIEDEGYDVIPEVKKYFKNLDIPMELLENVTSLYQDSGISGGSEFIYQLQPFWDPGAGDEVFKVSAKMINDLDFLPNLKTIIGLENSNPSKKTLKILSERNIYLEEEST